MVLMRAQLQFWKKSFKNSKLRLDCHESTVNWLLTTDQFELPTLRTVKYTKNPYLANFRMYLVYDNAW